MSDEIQRTDGFMVTKETGVSLLPNGIEGTIGKKELTVASGLSQRGEGRYRAENTERNKF